jgi:hypothetical protein
MPCDLGFIVGLCTHHHARLGSLVWIAQDVWDEFPTCDEIGGVERWRWPVFFPSAQPCDARSLIGYAESPSQQSLLSFPDCATAAAVSHGWNTATVK